MKVLTFSTACLVLLQSIEAQAAAPLPELNIENRSVIPQELLVYDLAIVPASNKKTEKSKALNNLSNKNVEVVIREPFKPLQYSTSTSEDNKTKDEADSNSLATPPLPTNIVNFELENNEHKIEKNTDINNDSDLTAIKNSSISVYNKKEINDFNARLAHKQLPSLEPKKTKEKSKFEQLVETITTPSSPVKVKYVDLPLDLIFKADSLISKLSENCDPKSEEFLHELTKQIREKFKFPVAGVKILHTTLDQIEFEVYAGKLDKLIIHNHSSLSDDEVKSFFTIKPGDVITENLTQKPLLLMQEQDLEVSGSFTSDKLGTANFIVDVNDSPRRKFKFEISSDVPENLGYWDLYGQIDLKNIFTVDNLNLDFSITDEGQVDFNAAYCLKVNGYGTFLGFKPFYNSYSTSHLQTVNNEIGHALGLEFFLKQPLFRDLNHSLDFITSYELISINDNYYDKKIGIYQQDAISNIFNIGLEGNSFFTDTLNLAYSTKITAGTFNNTFYQDFISSDIYLNLSYEYAPLSSVGLSTHGFLNKNALAPFFMKEAEVSVVEAGVLKYDRGLLSELYAIYSKNSFSISPYFQNLIAKDTWVGKSFDLCNVGLRLGFLYKGFYAKADAAFKINASTMVDAIVNDSFFTFDVGYNF